MKESHSRRLAGAVGRLAVRVCPDRHAEFARGMLAELEHIEGDFEALSFSAGNLWASLRMYVLSTAGLIAGGCLGVSAALAALACTAVFVSGGLRGSDEPMAILFALGFYYAVGSWLAAKRKAVLLAGYALIAVVGAGLTLGTLYAASGPVQHSAFYRALALEVVAIATGLLLAAGAVQALKNRLTDFGGSAA